MLQLLGILIILVVPVHSVSSPPGIYINPDKDLYYKPGETVEVACKARGSPPPSYRWKRNGVFFNPSGLDARVVQLPNSGTLVFNSPEEKDEGIYQCMAINDFGTSVSIRCNMRVAKLEEFINVPDQYHNGEVGQALTLPCVPPNSVPDAEVIWIKKPGFGFEAINYDARVTMDKEYRLRFAHVEKSDELGERGAYACMAMNQIMRKNVQSSLHFIRVTGSSDRAPTKLLWSDPFDQVAYTGDTFTMQCIFSGKPEPEIQWERTDNKSLTSRHSKVGFGHVLKITDLQPEDAGSYLCWATNANSEGRRANKNFNLRVKVKPYFIKKPENVEIGVGGNVEFTCMAGGDPPPMITWSINGLPLSDPELKVKNFERPVPTKLFFRNVSETDHMVIQCNATTSNHYVFADFYLNVLSEAPEFITKPEDEVISAEGLDVNLTCKTTGKPDPIISWYKDEVQVSGGRFNILSDGTLHIKGVVLADASQYRCEAVNKFGRVEGKGILVIRRKTRIEQKPGDLERNAGMDAKFTCSGTTDPEEVHNLRVYWLKDGDEILANDQRTTTNYQDNSLTISGTIVRDSGTYTCVATNGLDKATASAVLTVRDKPDRPLEVRQEKCNEDKNVTILWMPGSFNNAPLQYYVLQYNTSFNPDQWTFAMKVNGTWTKVSYPLSPYVEYNFRLIAYNKIGPSAPSAHTPRVCKSDNDIPAYHPKNLRTLGHETGKLYIEWTPIPPIHQNGPGFEYFLTWRRKGENSNAQLDSHQVTNWTKNYHIIESGYAYTPYEITIKALNSQGDAPGNPPSITGYSFEETPTIVPNNFAVLESKDTYTEFTWEFPRSEINKVGTRIRGQFMGFKITFWQMGNMVDTVREFDVGPDSAFNITGNTFKARVENMIPNTKMEAQIRVKNNFYVGRPSEIIKFETEPGLPGPVDFLRIDTIGDTHINLEWGSPKENRGDLEGYDISYQLVNGLELGEMQERLPQINSPFTTNAILSGLEPRRKYRVYIYARTLKGRGEGYFIELVTTKPITPEIPDFTIPNVGDTYINVSWWVDARKKSGSIVFVEFRKLDGAEWLRTSDEVVNTWQTIRNLEPGTKYEIRIKATNGAISIPSSIDEVTTDGNAKAYDLIENIGWFIGVLLSILLIIGLIVAFFLAYKHGFRFSRALPGQIYNSSSGAYSGSYDHQAQINKASDAKGYNNDYYDDKDNYDYDGKPPSYTSDYDRNGRQTATSPDYEDYDRKPGNGYDGDGAYDHQDYEGQDGYYDKRDDYDYDRRDDGYDYDNRDYDGYDYDRQDGDYDRREDYYGGGRNDGYGDRRDDDRGYGRRHDDDGYGRQSGNNLDLGRDDGGYDYDSEDTARRPAPRNGNGRGGAPPSSSFV